MRQILARLGDARATSRWKFCVGALRILGALVVVSLPLCAHDLERTQVVIRFERDGSFVVDVANDPQWLSQRIVNFHGPFADRIVLWVDGREVRPESDEYIVPPEAPPGELPALGVHRLRGRMPLDARTLRWYYGLVIDPYPLTIRRADGRIIVEEVAGDAWSGTIDLSRQFRASWMSSTRAAIAFVVAVLLLPPIVWLSKSRR